MLFNKIRISLTFIFFLALVCSISYNKYQYDKIQSYKTEVHTLRTTLTNVKQINEKNFLLDNKYNNILNTVNKGDPNDIQGNIKLFNNISSSLYNIYDTRLQ